MIPSIGLSCKYPYTAPEAWRYLLASYIISHKAGSPALLLTSMYGGGLQVAKQPVAVSRHNRLIPRWSNQAKYFLPQVSEVLVESKKPLSTSTHFLDVVSRSAQQGALVPRSPCTIR